MVAWCMIGGYFSFWGCAAIGGFLEMTTYNSQPARQRGGRREERERIEFNCLRVREEVVIKCLN